eukprot:GHVS01081681.1.p1 GENE.GHVS01081681.1~~GHVS01081681.1.p1  ORF type:complete len:489 (+),score=114.69 GHVS01081681.1:117-1583(+)
MISSHPLLLHYLIPPPTTPSTSQTFLQHSSSTVCVCCSLCVQDFGRCRRWVPGEEEKAVCLESDEGVRRLTRALTRGEEGRKVVGEQLLAGEWWWRLLCVNHRKQCRLFSCGLASAVYLLRLLLCYLDYYKNQTEAAKIETSAEYAVPLCEDTLLQICDLLSSHVVSAPTTTTTTAIPLLQNLTVVAPPPPLTGRALIPTGFSQEGLCLCNVHRILAASLPFVVEQPINSSDDKDDGIFVVHAAASSVTPTRRLCGFTGRKPCSSSCCACRHGGGGVESGNKEKGEEERYDVFGGIAVEQITGDCSICSKPSERASLVTSSGQSSNNVCLKSNRLAAALSPASSTSLPPICSIELKLLRSGEAGLSSADDFRNICYQYLSPLICPLLLPACHSEQLPSPSARLVTSTGFPVLINYDMTILGHAGVRGHFSPAVLCDMQTDSVLVLDVWPERPPVWVGVDDLYAAMDTVDPAGDRRGCILMRVVAEVES